jgi:tetratricopeptide (TPR) repeat protein
MNKENLLFGVVGLLAGLIIGFLFTNSINKDGSSPVAAAEVRNNSNIPPGHPEIGAPGGPTATGGAMQPAVQAAIEKAKQSPDDFDAQVKAAESYYQIERYDEAISFLKAANKIKPDDREIIVHLGNANFDADHYEEAEKWYTIALQKQADDVNVRTDLGLTFVFRAPPNYDRAIQEFTRSLATDPNHIQTLQNLTVAYTKKGDAAKATATVAKLEGIDPKNTSIAKLRLDIQNIGAAKP